VKVLYVSKALVTGAYRDKLHALESYCDVLAIVPSVWNGTAVDPVQSGERIELADTVLHGHNHFHLYRDVGDFIDRARPDLVHIDEEPYSAVTAQIARQCRHRSIPCCFFAWQNIRKRIPPPFGILRSYVFRTARGGIAGTAAAAEVLRSWGWRGPLAIIPQFGVDPERFRPDAMARARIRERLEAGTRFVLGYGGRLVTEKGVHLLIPAVASNRNVMLLLVGDGPERQRLLEAARSAGIADRVHVTGHIASREMPEWLNAMDALVLPSLTGRGWMEQFGRVLVEAMACGVPVIGSRSGEIPAVIGEAGVTVAEGDAVALSGAVARLEASPAERKNLAARGRARVQTHFTQAHIAQRTYGFYRDLLEAA
jgi:glycosyltransferase involved in cell wall biosynthesis